MISLITLGQKHWTKKHSTMFRTKVTISCLQVVLGILHQLGPVLDLQINLRFLKLVWNDSPNPKTLVSYQNYVSSTIRTKVTISLLEVVLGLLQPSTPFLTSRSIWGSWNWSQMIPPNPKHWFDTKITPLAWSEPKLKFHSMRSFWASYRPSTLFLAFRSIWGSWKLSPMIPLTPKHSVWYQNCFSNIIRTNWKCPCICLLLCGLLVYR